MPEKCQQAISSRVPKAVCRGTFTVWLMVSEWFGIVSQVLCGEKKGGTCHLFRKIYCKVPSGTVGASKTLQWVQGNTVADLVDLRWLRRKG